MLLYIIVFLIVFVLYLHLNFQLSVNNAVDFTEIALPAKDDLEKLCNIKQPFAINLYSADAPNAGVVNGFFKPSFTYKKIEGTHTSSETLTSLPYFRNYFFINDDNLCVKLFPPNSKEALVSENDAAAVDVWGQPVPANIKHVKIELKMGQILYIPPFWLVSFSTLERNPEKSTEKSTEKTTEKTTEQTKEIPKKTSIAIPTISYVTYPNQLVLLFQNLKDSLKL